VSITGLTQGTYNGSVQVTATGASNTPQTVAVTLTITARATQPSLAVSRRLLQFVTTAGGPAPGDQAVEVTNTGAGSLGWNATVSTTSGGAWLSISPTTGVAPATVTVHVNTAGLAQGSYTGAITVSALASSGAANSPQVVTVQLAIGAPIINDGGLVSGAGFTSACGSTAICSLFGRNFATGEAGATALPLPTTLASTQVLVKLPGQATGTPAPLFYVSPTQINFQMLREAAGLTVEITVVSGGIVGVSTTITVPEESPGIFEVGGGRGAILNQDFSLNTPANPAGIGSVILIYTSGLGATNPPLATGQAGATAEPLNRCVTTPIVYVGGTLTSGMLTGGTQADVLFCGAAPGFVGLFQINARLRAGTPIGASILLQVESNGKKSNPVNFSVN
jgi:uncharacterized protein (TIGR03437 family)